jgi:small-conductance mechanosensitive channel
MQKFIRLLPGLIVSAVIAMSAMGGAQAATIGDASALGQPAPAAKTRITPEQARHALEVLENDAKRKQTIEALRAIIGATASAIPEQAGAILPGSTAAEPAPTEAGAATETIVPNGLGAQLLMQVSDWIGELSDYIQATAQTITHFSLLWSWLEDTVNDPYSRERVLDAAWKLIVVFGVALLLEWLIQRGLQRPMAAIEERAERARRKRETAEASSPSVCATLGRHGWSFHLLQNLPFALVRFLLELVPVLAFAAAGNALLGTPLGTPVTTQLVILAVINAYVICRIVMAVTRLLVSPGNGLLRLIEFRDETAAYIETWARRIAVVAVFGMALAEVAQLLGLNRIGYAALVRIVMLVVHMFVVMIVLQCRITVADWLRAPEGQHGPFAVLRNRFAEVWHFIAIFFAVALWVVWALRVRDGYALVMQYFLATLAVCVAARLAGVVALGALDRLFRISPDFAARFPLLEARANRYYPVLRGTVSTIISAVAALVLLEVWGIDVLRWFDSGQIGGRLLSSLVTIAVAAAIALAIWESVNAALDRHVTELAREGRYSRATRLRTLLPIVRTGLLGVIITVVGLTALSEIGVNIAPLLAGAGIVGVAIGFGSQKLVQDLITGLFLLLENAMQVGDVVTVSGLSGKVEALTIRTIRLRATDGSVHIIPFSAVTSVTNTNRGIGNAQVSVNVPYKEDTDRVGEVLKEIAAEMRRDGEFKALIRGDLALWGVDKIDAGVVTILGQIECTDAGRWSVQREFNRRMKHRFEELGIEIAGPPAPMIVVQPAPEHAASALPRGAVPVGA